MIFNPIYNEQGKFYQDVASGKLVPSAGMIADMLWPDAWAGVQLDTLRKAALEGIGAHAILHQMAMAQMSGEPYSFASVQVPADYPGEPEDWTAKMERAALDIQEFFDHAKVFVIATEQTQYNQQLGFAGTPDLHCVLLYKRSRCEAVVDAKRVAAVTHDHLLKIQTYLMLPGFDKAKGLILHLKPEGGWALVHVPMNAHDAAALAAASIVLRWRLNKGGTK